MSEAEKVFSFTRMQALQLFQTLPTGKPKADYYLIVRGNKAHIFCCKFSKRCMHRWRTSPEIIGASEQKGYCKSNH
jgi:hypothetical protein